MTLWIQVAKMSFLHTGSHPRCVYTGAVCLTDTEQICFWFKQSSFLHRSCNGSRFTSKTSLNCIFKSPFLCTMRLTWLCAGLWAYDLQLNTMPEAILHRHTWSTEAAAGALLMRDSHCDSSVITVLEIGWGAHGLGIWVGCIHVKVFCACGKRGWPRTRLRDYISHLACELLCILYKELQTVAKEKAIWATLACCHCDPDLDSKTMR